jgi:hypothetical protein
VIGAAGAERSEPRVFGAGQEVKDLGGIREVADLGGIRGDQAADRRREGGRLGSTLGLGERGE